MAGSRREANKMKCRQQILKASRRLFKEKGYENTTIDDVAEKAEISKATLYNYFPNKESLLVGTMDEEIEVSRRYIEGLGEDVKGDEKIRKALTFLIIDSIPFISVSRRILFLNACAASPMFGKANDVKALFLSMTESAKAEGVFRQDVAAEEIVELLMSIYLSSQFQWSDIESITQQACEARVTRMLNLALAGCYTNHNE